MDSQNIKKECFICKIEKPLSDFYKHKGMVGGHLNKCKDCCKQLNNERNIELSKNPDWVEKEKSRHRNKYHRLGYKDKHKPSTERKRETIKRYNQKFPEKALARKYTEIFLIKEKGYNLHHWSYNECDWLDVIKLSIKEHAFLHRHIIYDVNTKLYKTLEGKLLNTRRKHLSYLKSLKFQQ